MTKYALVQHNMSYASVPESYRVLEGTEFENEFPSNAIAISITKYVERCNAVRAAVKEAFEKAAPGQNFDGTFTAPMRYEDAVKNATVAAKSAEIVHYPGVYEFGTPIIAWYGEDSAVFLVELK